MIGTSTSVTSANKNTDGPGIVAAKRSPEGAKKPPPKWRARPVRKAPPRTLQFPDARPTLRADAAPQERPVARSARAKTRGRPITRGAADHIPRDRRRRGRRAWRPEGSAIGAPPRDRRTTARFLIPRQSTVSCKTRFICLASTPRRPNRESDRAAGGRFRVFSSGCAKYSDVSRAPVPLPSGLR
jgi:hypothetical protein